jgi:hypothetical protein
MLSTRIPSVKDTYFQHKVLTKVHGKPTTTYESLQTLTTEIKANAGSVPSTSGGGTNDHLGMILSAARYATLAGTLPWVQPGNPGAFAPPDPPGTADTAAAERRTATRNIFSNSGFIEINQHYLEYPGILDELVDEENDNDDED